MKDTPIIPATEFKASEVLAGVEPVKLHQGQRYPVVWGTKERYRYLDIITAFDIETSSFQFTEGDLGSWQSWMYIWQWQVGDIVTVIGRTWIEFLTMVKDINDYLDSAFGGDCRLMCYIHNASFEFQYISGIWAFENKDVFATDVRDILYFMLGKIECRCSLRLSGYSLAVWAKELRADHQKMLGDLDYTKVRFWNTPLTSEELRYCINDVVCVVECVQIMLDSYGDNLYSIPFTATGYIRRKVKQAIKMWCYNGTASMMPDLETYDQLRNAFRGGDTHANRYWVEQLIADVHSYDRSSSYPDIIAHSKYPMSAFKREEPTKARFQLLLDMGRAVLMKVHFKDIKLKNEYAGDPYIPFDKVDEPGYEPAKGCSIDNGRIVCAEECEITVTDIDMEIIDDQYEWREMTIQWMKSARYGYLPQPFRDIVVDLYRKKTALKGVEGKELIYVHAKQEINSCPTLRHDVSTDDNKSHPIQWR